jgi:hypothetical protein
MSPLTVKIQYLHFLFISSNSVLLSSSYFTLEQHYHSAIITDAAADFQPGCDVHKDGSCKEMRVALL